MINKKVILVGHFAVGKTSLVRQFVHEKFDDHYLTTIGVKVDKKELNVNGQPITIILWDIAGEDTMKKVPPSYQLGAHGIIYVVDVTRPNTYESINEQVSELRKTLPEAPIVYLANKSDVLSRDMKDHFKHDFVISDFHFTSAKTGENVDVAFLDIVEKMLA